MGISGLPIFSGSPTPQKIKSSRPLKKRWLEDDRAFPIGKGGHVSGLLLLNFRGGGEIGDVGTRNTPMIRGI